MVRVIADRWGAPVQTEKVQAVALFDDAVEGLLSLSGHPVASAETTAAAIVLARILRAYLALDATTADGVADASKILEGLDTNEKQLDERERLHLRAAVAWSDGDWVGATRWLERALLHNARDLLALKVAQDLHFFLGSQPELREVSGECSPPGSPTSRGGDSSKASMPSASKNTATTSPPRVRRRAALKSDPHDVWSTHALEHVFEMEGRPREGVDFLNETVDDWSPSYFAIHNWWHRALYHLELGVIR